MINKDDVCLLRQFYPSMTLEAIGERFNVSRERIRQILKKAGLPTKAQILRKYCLHCGKKRKNRYRNYCSKACYHYDTHTLIPCDVCGRLSEYHIKRVLWLQARGKQQHFFCSKHCNGIWLGKNYGRASRSE